LEQSPLLTFAMGVNGNTLYANGNVGVNCSSGSSAEGGVMSLSGPIASDGTFVLSNSAQPLDSIQIAIEGKIPADGATTWAGSYKVVNATPPTGCLFNYSSDFVATAYTPLNGTYSGKITGPKLGSGITVITQISQGELASGRLLPTSPLIYYFPLSATITVGGSPTIKSGSTAEGSLTALSSSIRGNAFTLNFIMNDGSTVDLEGWFTDASESTLQVSLAPNFGKSSLGPSDICTLTRQ
jgi:hypothetical protein